MEHIDERTPQLGASQVPFLNQGPFRHLEPQKDLFEEGFSHSLQVVATEFQKLREPNMAMLKGGYSSNDSPVFQLWFKDIWVYLILVMQEWDDALSDEGMELFRLGDISLYLAFIHVIFIFEILFNIFLKYSVLCSFHSILTMTCIHIYVHIAMQQQHGK